MPATSAVTERSVLSGPLATKLSDSTRPKRSSVTWTPVSTTAMSGPGAPARRDVPGRRQADRSIGQRAAVSGGPDGLTQGRPCAAGGPEPTAPRRQHEHGAESAEDQARGAWADHRREVNRRGIPRSRESGRYGGADIPPMRTHRLVSFCCAMAAMVTLVSGSALAKGSKPTPPPEQSPRVPPHSLRAGRACLPPDPRVRVGPDPRRPLLRVRARDVPSLR